MWQRIEGNWHDFRESARHQWAKLTDDHLDEIDGRRDRLSARIAGTYGVTDEEAEKQVAAWETGLREHDGRAPRVDAAGTRHAVEEPRPGVRRDGDRVTLDNPGQEVNEDDRVGGEGLPTNQGGGRETVEDPR